MKHCLRHIAYIFLSSLLLLDVSCINDSLDDCWNHTGNEENLMNTVGYMSMRLQTSNGQTRGSRVGDEFEKGVANEWVLAEGQHHYAIFYNDEQAAPIAVATLTGLNDREEEENSKNSNTTSVVLATVVARSEYKDVLKRLQECFVVLNVDMKLEQLWTLPKDDLLNTLVNSPFYTADGKSYFTMCNSVFIENGKKVIASKVDTTKIYTSYMEAIERAWQGEAAVEAYVERLAAKFSLSFDRSDYNNPEVEKIFMPSDNQLIVFSELIDGIPYYKEGAYQIKITGWGMNALEKESYLFRNVKVDRNYFDGWYNPTNSRLFWSEDCNYSQAVYPWQYRKAIDNPGIPYYAGQDNILQNLSFEKLNNPFNREVIYTPENTYNFSDENFHKSLDSRISLLAGTHLIVCAELLTDFNGSGTFTTTDLYRDRNGNFYRSEKECFKALVTGFNNSLESHSFLKFIDYDWSKGGKENQEQRFAKTQGKYSLYYKDIKLTPENIDKLEDMLTSDAIIQEGDGKRLIWMDGMSIKDEDGKLLHIYSNIDEVDSKNDKWLREATTDDIKSLLFEHIGAVDHFNDGKMYYAVPVGYIKDEAKSDGYSVYGVVRNSVYTIVIDDVTGLGTSVDKVDDPIVPNKVTTHDHLFISFDILDWHLTEQNVPGVIN